MSHLKGEDRRSSLISILIPLFLSLSTSFPWVLFSLPNAALILLLDTWHETFHARCSGGYFPSSPPECLGWNGD